MSTWPNMPVGAQVLLDYDFNKSTMLASNVFDAYNSTISGTDGTAIVSPSSVVITRIVAGAVTGGAEIHWTAPSTCTDLFVAMSWRTNAAFRGRPQHDKMFFVRGPGTNSYFGMRSNPGAAQRAFGWGHNTSGLDNTHTMGDEGLWAFPNAGPSLITIGQWTRLETYIKKSTTNTSRDGIVRWWVNGVLGGNYTNVNYGALGLNEWVWSETWDGALNPPANVDWEHWLDHLFIATAGTSGGGGGGGTVTPVLTSLTPSAVTLSPGNTQVFTAGMSAAVTSNTIITLASSASSVATVGSTAVVSSGNSSTNFSVSGVSAGNATITATLGGVTQSSAVTVAPSSGGGVSTTYTFASQFSGVQGQNQWTYRDTSGNLLTYNPTGKWEGTELYLAIWNSGFVHGYNGAFKGAVLRWTAPGAGSVSVTGSTLLYDVSGLGTFEVEYNGVSKFGPQTMSYGVTYPYAFTQAVSSGDVIDFIMTGTSAATNDNTQLNPVIVYTPTSSGGSSGVTVSSMTPSHGNIGSSVTIVGTGFSSTAINNTVTVNGVAATVTSASSTQIVFTVPTGATTGLVNVSTSAGSGSAGTYTVDNPVTPDVPPASNFGGSATLLLVMP